jgi:RNA polymerase sigma-54 factor
MQYGCRKTNHIQRREVGGLRMQLDYGLKLEIAQRLVMTPQLRQAIAVLQLNSLELTAMIEKELLENPVLEVEEKPATADEGEYVEKQPLEEYLDWADYFNDGMDRQEHRSSREKVSPDVMARNIVSLHDHLELQLHLSVRKPADTIIGKYIIGCIDDNGYLCGTLDEAAKKLNVSPARVEEMLLFIQTFDPPGVGARNLQECLRLQIQQKGLDDPHIDRIVAEYLTEVAAGRFKLIAEQLKCKPHEVQEAVDIIRTLDPKPGRAFGGGDSGYIVPDVTVERVNGKYVILINDSSVPQLTVNPYYRRVVQEADSELRRFIESRLNSAVWLIKSIEQRRRTLYNVMEALIELQRDFFDQGHRFLRPLTMRQVAERIEMHESTVSRAIANKYANTPHGLVALRSFFITGIQSSGGGEDVAAVQVKQKIKDLIAAEDQNRPFSDQDIAERLSGQGIRVSRRTVAKYREEMGILASSKRKRY